MRGSMVDIQSATAENRRGKKMKKPQLQNSVLLAAIITETNTGQCKQLAITDTRIHVGRYRENIRTGTNDAKTRMCANAQRDGSPVEYRWRPLFNAAKFG